jgi:WD40 repeat protein
VRLVSYAKDGGAHVWDCARGHLTAVLRGYDSRLCCVAFAAEGKTIAAGTEDGKLLLWDAYSQTLASQVSPASHR